VVPGARHRPDAHEIPRVRPGGRVVLVGRAGTLRPRGGLVGLGRLVRLHQAQGCRKGKRQAPGPHQQEPRQPRHRPPPPL
ncbi:MAG: hypothetical protein AVDCRST_MAG51-2640, partial [uncultured Ramlibacter sp.]